LRGFGLGGFGVMVFLVSPSDGLSVRQGRYGG
jgi:hypothetical protein